jgi:hypothetical protein
LLVAVEAPPPVAVGDVLAAALAGDACYLP